MFDKLRQTRINQGLSCEDMSGIIGLKTRGAYHKKENGNVPFRLDEAEKISRFFKKPIEEIFFENEVSFIDTGKEENSQ